MKKVIDISTEVREGIRKVFKVSEPAIWYALTYDDKRGQSDKAKRIRQYARMNGGVEVMVAEKTDTLLYDYNGFLRQYFPNGAMIEISKNDGSGDLYLGGKKVTHFDTVLIRDIEKMQRTAAAL